MLPKGSRISRAAGQNGFHQELRKLPRGSQKIEITSSYPRSQQKNVGFLCVEWTVCTPVFHTNFNSFEHTRDHQRLSTGRVTRAPRNQIKEKNSETNTVIFLTRFSPPLQYSHLFFDYLLIVFIVYFFIYLIICLFIFYFIYIIRHRACAYGVPRLSPSGVPPSLY